MASLEGSAGGGGAARDGVGEVGGVVAVLGVGPVDRWRCVLSDISPMRPVTTVMRQASSSSSSPPPLLPLQPDEEDPSPGATRLGQGPHPWMAHGRPRRPH
jgi:hypothetical protein